MTLLPVDLAVRICCFSEELFVFTLCENSDWTVNWASFTQVKAQGPNPQPLSKKKGLKSHGTGVHVGITADLGANFLLQENGVIFGLKTEQLKAIIVPVHMCAGLSY